MVYGIPNCDSVKKVRAWLGARDIGYEFHDYKKHGVPELQLSRWVAATGWEKLLNCRGTTWRGLDEFIKASVVDAASAIAVMLVHPGTVKRPLVTLGDVVVVVGVDFDALAAFSLSDAAPMVGKTKLTQV